jgi:hypothetical protein
MSVDEGVAVPQPLLLIQATRPSRHTLRDTDLRAYRWRDMALRIVEIVIVSDTPSCEIDWQRIMD